MYTYIYRVYLILPIIVTMIMVLVMIIKMIIIAIIETKHSNTTTNILEIIITTSPTDADIDNAIDLT